MKVFFRQLRRRGQRFSAERRESSERQEAARQRLIGELPELARHSDRVLRMAYGWRALRELSIAGVWLLLAIGLHAGIWEPRAWTGAALTLGSLAAFAMFLARAIVGASIATSAPFMRWDWVAAESKHRCANENGFRSVLENRLPERQPDTLKSVIRSVHTLLDRRHYSSIDAAAP